MKRLPKILGLMIFLSCAIPVFAHTHEAQPTSAPQSESLFNLTDAWINHDGKPFHLAELGGNPSVIAMTYTSCKDVCPLIVEDMKKIEHRLPATLSGKVKFAVFSFDSERDTTKKLKEFAEAHGIDAPAWVTATAKPEAVRRLAVALGMKYKKTKSGDFEHGISIYVLDSAGVVQYAQTKLGQDAEEAVSMIKKLAH